MANSFTANLVLEKPEVGADSNLWGGHTNSNWDIVDSVFTSATTRPISTIIKSNTRIVDATTTSKSILFALTNITTTTGRLLTVQDASGTLAYVTDITSAVGASTVGVTTTGQLGAATTGMVDVSSTQTLSNKTLTGIGSASTATTQTAGANTTTLATTAYADRIGVQQIVTTITGAVSTGSTIIPLDDTIPQINEGDQYMSLAITPKSATSKLVIEVALQASQNLGGANNITAALFQDSTANALAAMYVTSSNQFEAVSIVFTYEMTSGTTSATTFKVRAGISSTAVLTFNGAASARLLGGAMASSIIITEIGF